MSKKTVFLVFLLFAGLGLVFSATSVYDSIAHLDREIHSVSCSYIPGSIQDETGESGCYAVMMSPYSSVLQHMTWGGIPIALGSVAVFAFLVFLGLELMVTQISALELKKTYFLMAAAAFPLAISIIYLGISLNLVGTVCKTCVGIYVSSLGVFIGSVLSHNAVSNEHQRYGDPKSRSGSPWGYYIRVFFEGVVFVAVVIGVFLAMKPAYSEKDHECGNLIHQQDPDSVMIPINRVAGGATAIEIVDPLCPACQMFRDRLDRSDAATKLDLRAVLFPLESECNWMVSESMHPGACMVAEAVLCSKNDRAAIMNWALDNHEILRELAKENQKSLKVRIVKEFPAVASCIGTMEAKIRVNKSLRWIVSNSSRVMTPQLFVNGVRLCEEDTDLGLEFALTKLLQRDPFIPPVKSNREALERMRAVAPVEPLAPTGKPDGGVAKPVRADGGVIEGAKPGVDEAGGDKNAPLGGATAEPAGESAPAAKTVVLPKESAVDDAPAGEPGAHKAPAEEPKTEKKPPEVNVEKKPQESAPGENPSEGGEKQ